METARLDAIIRKRNDKKAWFNPQLERDMFQQMTRMLRMDDATRNSALRCGTWELDDACNFHGSFVKALIAYHQEIEACRLLNRIPGQKCVDSSKSQLRDQVLELALFEATVLRSRKIPLDNPAPALLQRWCDPNSANDSALFVNDCTEFLLKHVMSRRAREYIGFCLSLTPHAGRQLGAISELMKLYQHDPQGGFVEYFDACRAFSETLGDHPKNDISEVFATAIALHPATTCVYKVQLQILQHWRLMPDDETVFKRAAERLNK